MFFATYTIYFTPSSSNSSAPLYVKSADKVFVTLASGSENSLCVSGEYAEDEENKVDGVIFSKSDITFNGTGKLAVKAEYGHGIVGKDDVVFVGGSYEITAASHGISANDSVRIADGSFTITSGKDGIQVDNDKDTSLGYLYIENGKFIVNTEGDGLSASGTVTISDGDFNIVTGDDGIHSDSAVVINDGSFSVPYCYEGIEGLSITVDGGSFDIISSDDGFNAAGGTDSSGFVGKENPFEATDGAFITISGGAITVVSDGDSIDSNGSLTINGGTLNLTCNGNGNTALDASGTFTNNGGKITTNDGSESGNHMMGGGPGGNRPNKGECPDMGERPQGSPDGISSATKQVNP